MNLFLDMLINSGYVDKKGPINLNLSFHKEENTSLTLHANLMKLSELKKESCFHMLSIIQFKRIINHEILI